jgi:hypothetical protein
MTIALSPTKQNPRKAVCRGGTLNAKFDIFVRESDGQPIWVKAVETLEEARNQVATMAQAVPGDYFIFNALSGKVILG